LQSYRLSLSVPRLVIQSSAEEYYNDGWRLAMVHAYSYHDEVDTALQVASNLGRPDSRGGRFRGRLVKQISRTAVVAVVIFPVCVIRETLCYMSNLSG
jgi:hypothetical protein